jgi:hypothetical protein
VKWWHWRLKKVDVNKRASDPGHHSTKAQLAAQHDLTRAKGFDLFFA